MGKKCFLLFILLISFFNQVSLAQTTKENLQLKDQVSKLQVDLEEQKSTTAKLIEQVTDLIENQNTLIKDFTQTSKVVQDLQVITEQNKKQLKFKDAFVLNKEGRPVAFIDNDLKLYDYYGKDLLGWIKLETNELVRNYDESVIAQIENDFLIDDTGHVIGSIERSENLKWDREKLYPQVQKRPLSQYFIKLENPKQFNPNTFRFSDWSNQKLEDILFFNEKKIQRLR